MRPSEIWSSMANSWARVAGVREKQLRIEVPIVTRLVFAAIRLRNGIRDGPQASPEETCS